MKVRPPNHDLERVRLKAAKEFYQVEDRLRQLCFAVVWDTLGAESFTLLRTWNKDEQGDEYWQYDLIAVDGEPMTNDEIWEQIYPEGPFAAGAGDDFVDLFDIMNWIVTTSHIAFPELGAEGQLTYYRSGGHRFEASISAVIEGTRNLKRDLEAA